MHDDPIAELEPLHLAGKSLGGHLRYAGEDLILEGVRLDDLVTRFGTPLHVLSISQLRDNYRRMQAAFERFWNPAPVRILYSIKANYATAVWQVLNSEGAGADCMGFHELRAALAGKVSDTTLNLNGSHKTALDIDLAVAHGARVTVDDCDEIDLILDACDRLNRPATLAVRLRPDLREFGDLHSEISGDNIREHVLHTKWGLTENDVVTIASRCANEERLSLVGAHFHIGRQLGGPQLFELFIPGYVRFLSEVAHNTGWFPEVLNIGGGFTQGRDPYNWKNRRSDAPSPEAHGSPEIDDYTYKITSALRTELKKIAMPLPTLECETGRYMVGNAGCTLTRVGAVKRLADATWVSVDVGTNQVGMARAPQDAHAIVPLRLDRPRRTAEFEIVGPLCVPDVLAGRTVGPVPEKGEHLAILDTGAYADTEASNANAIPRPAVIAVSGDSASVIRERETFEDVFHRDRLLLTAEATATVDEAKARLE